MEFKKGDRFRIKSIEMTAWEFRGLTGTIVSIVAHSNYCGITLDSKPGQTFNAKIEQIEHEGPIKTPAKVYFEQIATKLL